jgi:hypothetical protein
MKDQFIHSPVGDEVELHPEALKFVDDERSALVGTEFVGWLAANCQRELSIVVLPDNSSRASVAERAGAVLTEGRIRAIAAWNAGEDNIFDQRLERHRQTRNAPSRPVENEMASRSGSRRSGASGSSNVS